MAYALVAMLTARELTLAIAIVLTLSWWFIDQHLLNAALEAFR